MTTDLTALGEDLRLALARRIERRSRRRRRLAAGTCAAVAACGLSAAAIASGIAGDLQLDPTKWSILGSGSVDEGRGEYVHATSLADGSSSTFLVEHDAGLAAYDAFLLHERTVSAAQQSSPVPVRPEPGPVCTPAQLTRAETVALAALGKGGTALEAVRAEFGGSPCRGLEYAAEQATGVHDGVQPASTLMPGVEER
jgi:hypothetical protein